MRVPDIHKGFHKLTPEYWRRIGDAVEGFERMQREIQSIRNRHDELPLESMWAGLLAYRGWLVNRWQYAWLQMSWVGDGFTPMIGGLTSSGVRYSEGDALPPIYGNELPKPGEQPVDWFAYPAINAAEAANDGVGVESGGVDVNGASYPAGFDLIPIRGTLASEWSIEQAPVVRMHLTRARDHSLRYVFFAMNHHDGTCDPPGGDQLQSEGIRISAEEWSLIGAL